MRTFAHNCIDRYFSLESFAVCLNSLIVPFLLKRLLMAESKHGIFSVISGLPTAVNNPVNNLFAISSLKASG